MIHFGYLSEGKITLCMPTKRVLDTTATITSSFHWYLRRSQLISLRVSFLSRVDELHDLLASSPCMGLHGSAGRALQRERREAMGSNPVEAPKSLFGLFRN